MNLLLLAPFILLTFLLWTVVSVHWQKVEPLVTITSPQWPPLDNKKILATYLVDSLYIDSWTSFNNHLSTSPIKPPLYNVHFLLSPRQRRQPLEI